MKTPQQVTKEELQKLLALLESLAHHVMCRKNAGGKNKCTCGLLECVHTTEKLLKEYD